MSNSKLKQCLTVDTRDVNDLGPGKFRTQADSGTEQMCYYNRKKMLALIVFWQREKKHYLLVK